MLKTLILFLFILAEMFSANSVFATNSLDVIINEIAWTGTNLSYNDEWIELYNNTNTPINLDHWTLKTINGSPEIYLSGIIQAKNFYLLERTNDNTVSKIPANQIYTGSLNNKGENLELYDNLGNLIDSVNCSSGWFKGDNKTKQTMERKFPKQPGSHPGSWQTSQNPEGTPKAKNSIVVKKLKTEIKTEKAEDRPLPSLSDGKLEEKAKQEQDIENIKNLATVSKQIPKSHTPFFILFISSVIAIFSGIIILTLKKKIKAKN